MARANTPNRAHYSRQERDPESAAREQSGQATDDVCRAGSLCKKRKTGQSEGRGKEKAGSVARGKPSSENKPHTNQRRSQTKRDTDPKWEDRGNKGKRTAIEKRRQGKTRGKERRDRKGERGKVRQEPEQTGRGLRWQVGTSDDASEGGRNYR